ncbi:hypothetical protein CL614_04325 [archaeon]|nr:hypothetical protein [archaeon]|tara:strand:+ start:1068 stop:1442 length:375 start_codon:yes stop_codon:yes gene_type:complete
MISKRKGQWLIISAVVISTVFLVISTTFLSYFGVENSNIASRDEPFIANNIENKMNNIFEIYQSRDPCPQTELQTNLNNFVAFSEKEYAKNGYFVNVTYELTGCTSIDITKIAVESDTMNVLLE